MSTQYEVVHNADTLNALFERVRAAQRSYASFSQEQVDKIFLV